MASIQMGNAYGFVLLLGLLLCLQCNCLSEEGWILLQVKESWNTSGALGDWISDSNGNNHCHWTGVTCDRNTKSVVCLDLENLNISGTIPSSICKLGDLSDLNLPFNYFDGAFPSGLLNCTHLRRLNLSQNVFVGSLPVRYINWRSWCSWTSRSTVSRVAFLLDSDGYLSLRECAHFMVNFHLNAEGNKLRVVYRKYSIPFFGCVSSLVPANLPGDDSCSSNN